MYFLATVERKHCFGMGVERPVMVLLALF